MQKPEQQYADRYCHKTNNELALKRGGARCVYRLYGLLAWVPNSADDAIWLDVHDYMTTMVNSFSTKDQK